MAAVQEAVPADGFRLFGVDPGTLLVNRLLAASASDGWARLEWLREVYLAAEPLTYLELPTLMRANLPAVAFHDRQETCWGYPPAALGGISARDHHRLFHELRSPVGGTLLAGFPGNGVWVAALQSYRRDPDRPFRAGASRSCGCWGRRSGGRWRRRWSASGRRGAGEGRRRGRRAS